MKKSLAIRVCAALALGVTQAAAADLAAVTEGGRAAPMQPGPRPEAEAQNPIQSLCREIFVDTDEGYGVTNRESRTICDDPR